MRRRSPESSDAEGEFEILDDSSESDIDAMFGPIADYNTTETDNLLPGEQPPPTDRFNFVYLVFFFMGMGTLLPWNFFISVNSFWDYKFRDVNATDPHTPAQNQTELQKEFTSYLAIASNFPNALFVIINALVGQRFLLKHRLFLSLGLIIFFFSLVTTFSRTDSDLWQSTFLDLMLALVVLINMCTAVYQGGVFGVAGKFPPVYMGAVMAGQAMGGIFPALIDILVISVQGIKEKDVGFACFLVATLFLVVAFVLFAAVRKTPLFKYYAEDRPTEFGVPQTPVSFHVVFQRSWVYCLGVFITFATTLAVFPAITVLVQSQYRNHVEVSTWANKYFTPVTCFLLFNCGDYVGRMAASKTQWPDRTKKGQFTMLSIAVARIVFIPLFMLCNAAPTKRSMPILIHSDAIYVLLMALFALSNGYLGSICMLHGPKTSQEFGGSRESQIESSKYMEVTAMVMVACLVLGAGFGSVVSYVVVSIL